MREVAKSQPMYTMGTIRKAVAKHRGVQLSYLIAGGQRPGWLHTWTIPDREAPLGPPDDRFGLASRLTKCRLTSACGTTSDGGEGRAQLSTPKGKENMSAFKERLRRVALATPAATLRTAAAAMRSRAAMVVTGKGQDIRRD